MPEDTTNPKVEQMNKVYQIATETYDRFLSIAEANTCFGKPIQVDNKTIIPTAEVICATGFGVGYGGAEDQSEEKSGEGGEGGGGGGGGFTRSRAVAVITVSPEGVNVDPIIDATQVAMAGIAATAFVGYWLVRLMKSTGEVSSKAGPSFKSLMGLLK